MKPKEAPAFRRGEDVTSLSLIVVGGTFDGLHAGHRRLISEAFRYGKRVGIGLATESLIARFPGKGARVTPFQKRMATLKRWLTGNYPPKRWYMAPLDTIEGRILDADIPALAVSEETVSTGFQANKWRLMHGITPLVIVAVCRVYADDLMPVASRRVRSGLIHGDGRRRLPLRIALQGSDTETWRDSILQGFESLLPKVRVTPASGETDYTVCMNSGMKKFKLSVTDSSGDRLEASLRMEGAHGQSLANLNPSLRDAVLSQLLEEAFLPRRLAKEGLLPTSVVLNSEITPWHGTGKWTRKVYSRAGIFPFQ